LAVEARFERRDLRVRKVAPGRGEDGPPAVIYRDIRQHYRNDYRILKAASGREALEPVRQLKQRGAPVSLLFVDQRTPEVTGTELLREVLRLYPESRKVLLTAYADAGAASP
jgi:thioredoxin reductase (NADPH)